MSLVKALFFIKKGVLPTDKVKKKYICVKGLEYFFVPKKITCKQCLQVIDVHELFYQLFSGRSLRTTVPACHISVSRISRSSSSSFWR